MDDQRVLIRRAVDGQEGPLRELVDLITPSIHKTVAATLRRRVGGAARDRARHEVEDVIQEVLIALFANGGRRLLQWDPSRGLSLPRYVELVSRHLAESFLRARGRRVWENSPLDGEELDHIADGAGNPESLAEHRELLRAVLAALEVELTPEAREVFNMLLLDERSVEEICAATGLTPNAVHLKRHRFLKSASNAARRILRGDFADGDG